MSLRCSCLSFLYSLLQGRTEITLLEFISVLCDVLCEFPILILFESPVRLGVLHFLQLIGEKHPQLLTSRGNLVLLIQELLYWLMTVNSRMRNADHYSHINRSIGFLGFRNS